MPDARCHFHRAVGSLLLWAAACQAPPDDLPPAGDLPPKAYEWYARYGGSELEDASGTELIRVRVGRSGDLYVASMTGVYDWDAEEYVDYLTVARLTPEGDEVWQLDTDLRPAFLARLHTVPVDGGGLLVGRSIRGEYGSLPAIGGKDILVSYYLPDGTIDWQWRVGTEDDDILHGLSVGRDGRIYLVRQTWTPPADTLPPFEPQTPIGAYLVEYAADGEELRTTELDGNVSDIAADRSGNVFVATITYELLPGGQTPTRYLSVLRFNSSGEQVWTNRTPSTGDAAIFVDDEDRLYLAYDRTQVEVHRINPATGSWAWSQYLPGELARARSIAVRDGIVAVALDQSPPDEESFDRFDRHGSSVVRLDAATGQVLATGFVGSVCGNASYEIAIGIDGQVFLGGAFAESPLVQYPPGANAACDCDHGSVCVYGFVAEMALY